MEYCAYCGNSVERVSSAPCARCGNPTNGAPRPVARGGSNAVVVVVVAVFGGLVLIAVIGIIAAIAIPNLLTAQNRAKQRRTMADLRSIASAAEAYATDNNQYPETLAVLVPKYIKAVPAADGWGHRFEYECLTDETGKCTGYVIGSGGRDGLMERGLRDAAAQPRGGTTHYDCDIVYSNGSFVEYPGGVQR